MNITENSERSPSNTIDYLSKNLASHPGGSMSQQLDSGRYHARMVERPPLEKLWVVRYVDYTSKYGLGYLLNSGAAGVYFNDSTKMCGDLDNFVYASYFVRYRGQSEQRLTLRIADEDHKDPDIRKKLILIRNFKAFITSENPKEGTERGRSVLPLFRTSGAREDDEVHLRKYVRTRQAIVFVLSNKTQHVIFVDGSEDEVALMPGLEVSVAMPKFSDGVRNFRLTDDIRDERLRRRVDQAVAIIHGLGIHQTHGG